MTWNYAYTATIWPSVFTALFLTALYVYSWRRRGVPGALPFAISQRAFLECVKACTARRWQSA